MAAARARYGRIGITPVNTERLAATSARCIELGKSPPRHTGTAANQTIAHLTGNESEALAAELGCARAAKRRIRHISAATENADGTVLGCGESDFDGK